MSATRSTSSRTSCRSTTCLPSRSRGGWIISPTTLLPGNSCAPARSAADLLRDARAGERAARIPEAIASYEAAIAGAERGGQHLVLAEALRRLAVVRHRRGDSADARELCRRSHAVSRHAGDTVLAGEALNTLGGIDLETDAIADAHQHFLRALELGGQSRELRAAIELALGAGAVLHEAEASRELALLHQAMGRNQEALTLLNAAHRLFGRLDARREQVHVNGKMAELEATYLAVVREWGQSIESADPYTFGHCERVARHGVAVARPLGMDERAQTTLRLGAYLHDLGKVRVPHEILTKPGPLTRNDLELVQMHPIGGIEQLASVEV